MKSIPETTAQLPPTLRHTNNMGRCYISSKKYALVWLQKVHVQDQEVFHIKNMEVPCRNASSLQQLCPSSVTISSIA